ncbi:hypothetical protein [uncultured Sphingomonas sp.]|uniref:hypothetical protein n=1 Tax=uncultured Sphingomonas sp. TaxID=158754 RepID=UPI002600B2A1|nr:hypothetical protein [uncultured Sphingomonas sp.]
MRLKMSQVIYTFRVGKRLFRLAADAMRAHSIAVERFEPISATAMKGLELFLEASNADEIVAKAKDFDEAGDIRMTLRVQQSQKELFQAARVRAGASEGEPAPTRFTLTVGLLSVFPSVSFKSDVHCR